MHRQERAGDKERIQLLYLLKSGQAESVTHAAEILGRGRVTLQRWLAQYEEYGIEGLLHRQPRLGRACQIPQVAQRQLVERLSSSDRLAPASPPDPLPIICKELTQMQANTKAQPNQPSRFSWFTRKRAFQTGLFFGFCVGVGISASGGFVYLSLTRDMVGIRDGRLVFNKSTTTASNQESLNPQGNQNAVANNQGTANSGDGSQTARDPDNSFNRGDNSPSVVGNYNNVTIISNRDLPGYDAKSGFLAPPSDLSQYTKSSDLQPDAFVRQASDVNNIRFDKQKVIILGKAYTSFFDVSPYANESRFVFELDGSQKAALLQFGLPDLASGSTSSGAYIVKIFADGQALWAGECKRSQGRQIISVPISIPGAKTLTIEVSSNGQDDSRLYFTEARLFKN
jgi:transposase